MKLKSSKYFCTALVSLMLCSSVFASVYWASDCPTPDTIRGNNVATHNPLYDIHSYPMHTIVSLYQDFVPLKNPKGKVSNWVLDLIFTMPKDQTEHWAAIKKKAQLLYNTLHAPAEIKTLDSWEHVCVYHISSVAEVVAYPQS